MEKDSKIYVAGHTGLLGSALTLALDSAGYKNLILRSRRNLDLRDQNSVNDFFNLERPEYVFLAAAHVGGIAENIAKPVEFLENNLQIELNVISAAHRAGVKKLLFFTSNCCYPRLCPQPMKEEYLLTGPLEPTNEAYAMAKIAGMKLCESYHRQFGSQFFSVVLASLYGPQDHFGQARSHVVADMIYKFHGNWQGKDLTFFGDGSPLREFMHTDDAAAAAIFMMQHDFPKIAGQQQYFINAGTGEEVSMFELTQLLSEVSDNQGKINWDTSKPNGMPRKLLDSGLINSLGWSSKVALRDGIRKTYTDYVKKSN